MGVNDKPQQKHYGFARSARAALMIGSIWREVRLLVPLRSDSAPITRNTLNCTVLQ
jgi:hypothetical protein